ncbi:Retrovirus-related Pol polyprotein from transposon [Dictyocoela roeselum]|nr:Retrovirus-related Pol polyprotein from transposon [Dictyocoela roeselum]
MNTDMILGMDFLLSNDAIINLNDYTVSIDGKFYELKHPDNIDDGLKELVRKTKISTIVNPETYFSDKINNLIKEYKIKNPEIERITGTSHQINLTSNDTIDLPSYRIPNSLREAVRKEVDYLIKNRIIRQSCSAYGFPVFPIVKKNGRIRVVIDYRKLNEITVKKHYVFPKIQDILSSYTGSCIFSTIDLNMGYYQIPMMKDSIQYTAFKIENEKYEFLRMPFGLSNAPMTFQNAMESLFTRIEGVLIYLDDILIHTKDIEGHYETLKRVFTIIRENKMSVNFEKSHLLRNEITFLGHFVNKNGI